MDVMKKVGNSLLQHGKSSNRVYLMSLDSKDIKMVLEEIEHLVDNYNYSKVIAKISEDLIEPFENAGYIKEAIVRGYFQGKKDGIFVAKYYSEERKIDKNYDAQKDIINLALKKRKYPTKKSNKNLEKDRFMLRRLIITDASEAVKVYKKVFETYPFPIHEESYLIETMKENVSYFGIWDKNKLVAISSIEASEKYKNAEMTDFAVLEEYRGYGLGKILLDSMEVVLKEKGYKTAYTIARASSYGMNITFTKNDYEYGGTLTNNTQIAGSVESMNVWYKDIK